jgi:biotin transporter BioY
MSEFRFSLLHKCLVVFVNMLVLGALTFAMYRASFAPEEFTLVFLKVFGGMLVPIIALGIVGKRYLQRKRTALQETA